MDKDVSSFNIQYCTVCNKDAEGDYCSNCGQKIAVREVSILKLIGDFFSNVLSLERSMFGMIYAIFWKPKMIVENYQKGYRGYYSSPGRMMLYSLTVAVLHLALVNDELLGLSFEVENIQPQLAFWTIFLPVIILTSYVSFFRLHPKFVRHFISIIYLSSTVFISTIVFTDFFEQTFEMELESLPFMVFLLIVFLLNARVNGNTKWYRVLLNTLLQVIVMFGIMSLLIGLVYLHSPESIMF